MTEDLHGRERALLARAHDGIAAALVACRPLVWDEIPTEPSVIAYDALVVAGLVLLAVEAIGGLRRHWLVSGRGLLLAALLAILGVAAVRSPMPAQGWGLYAQLLADGGLAWYVLQILPGRARLLGAALGSGLVAELVIGALQEIWVLPAMARSHAAHQLTVAPQLADLVAERIQNGGVFGTFTQANALAGYLLCAAPPVLAALWNGGRRPRWSAIALGALALVIAALTASKASYLAIFAAVGLAFFLTRERVAVRGGVMGGALGVAGLTCALAPIRHRVEHVFQDSAHLRLGYWAGGAALVVAHPLLGTGLSGYRDGVDAVLPDWAQYSTHAHSEPIEAAAEAGLPAGIALLALLAWLPWARRPLEPGGPAEAARPRALAPVAAAAALLYLGLLGMCQSNIGWWPGGELLAGQLAWSLAVAVLAAIVLGLLARMPPPPPMSCAIALGALALHCLVDFDLHAGGVVGTAAVVAALAGGRVWRLGAAAGADGAHGAAEPPEPPEPTAPGRMRAPSWIAASLATACAAAAVAWWGWFSARERAASEVVDFLQDALTHSAPTQAQADGLRQIAEDLGVEPAGNQGVLSALVDRTDALAWADYPLRLRLLDLRGRGPELIAPTAALAREWPDCAPVYRMLAEDERRAASAAIGTAAAAEHWHAALAHLRQAIARSPWYLPTRTEQVLLLTQAAAALPDERIGLQAAAAQEEAEIVRLRGVVDWTNQR